MKRLLVLTLAFASSLLAARASLFSSSAVLVEERDDANSFENHLDTQIQSGYGLKSSAASSDQSADNSTMHGMAKAKIDPVAALYEVGVSINLDTASTTQPAPGDETKIGTVYTVNATADQRDHITVKTRKPYSNLTAEITFEFNGSTPDAFGDGSNITANLTVLGLASNAGAHEVKETHFRSYNKDGPVAGGDNFFESNDSREIMIKVPLGPVDANGAGLDIQASVNLTGQVNKYMQGSAIGQFLDDGTSGLGLRFVLLSLRDDDLNFVDGSVVGNSGFDYQKYIPFSQEVGSPGTELEFAL